MPHHPIYDLWPDTDIRRVFNQEFVEIDGSFPGFVETYARLAPLIPEHWTVVDLGCAYNPQCIYFKDHIAYIAVDDNAMMEEMFTTPNCQVYRKSIESFLAGDVKDLDMVTTFAICNYVPLSAETTTRIRQVFPNLYMYYPAERSTKEKEMIQKFKKRLLR